MRIHRVLGGHAERERDGTVHNGERTPRPPGGQVEMQVHGRTRETKVKEGKEGNRCGGAGASCAGV